MSGITSSPSCDRPIAIIVSNPTIAVITSPRPVELVVTCAPSPRPLNLSDDQNFVLLPIVGGTLARVPYDPVA